MGNLKLLSVNVTQEHIQKGKKRSCDTCPVALAVSEAFGFPVTVEKRGYNCMNVRYYVRWEQDKGKLSGKRFSKRIFYNILLPSSINDFIERFDDFGDISPIQFNMASHTNEPQQAADTIKFVR